MFINYDDDILDELKMCKASRTVLLESIDLIIDITDVDRRCDYITSLQLLNTISRDF